MCCCFCLMGGVEGNNSPHANTDTHTHTQNGRQTPATPQNVPSAPGDQKPSPDAQIRRRHRGTATWDKSACFMSSGSTTLTCGMPNCSQQRKPTYSARQKPSLCTCSSGELRICQYDGHCHSRQCTRIAKEKPFREGKKTWPSKNGRRFKPKPMQARPQEKKEEGRISACRRWQRDQTPELSALGASANKPKQKFRWASKPGRLGARTAVGAPSTTEAALLCEAEPGGSGHSGRSATVGGCCWRRCVVPLPRGGSGPGEKPEVLLAQRPHELGLSQTSEGKATPAPAADRGGQQGC